MVLQELSWLEYALALSTKNPLFAVEISPEYGDDGENQEAWEGLKEELKHHFKL